MEERNGSSDAGDAAAAAITATTTHSGTANATASIGANAETPTGNVSVITHTSHKMGDGNASLPPTPKEDAVTATAASASGMAVASKKKPPSSPPSEVMATTVASTYRPQQTDNPPAKRLKTSIDDDDIEDDDDDDDDDDLRKGAYQSVAQHSESARHDYHQQHQQDEKAELHQPTIGDGQHEATATRRRPPSSPPETPMPGGGSRPDDHSFRSDFDNSAMPKTPVAMVDRQHSTAGSSSPSDLSSSSRGGGRDASMSPSTPYVPEVPPAPPSTPASDFQSVASSRFAGLSTPLPYQAVQNADRLLEQQQLADGAVTPAPTRSDASGKQQQHGSQSQKQPPTSLVDDFSEWAVGDRYQLLRMLGQGSYGQVAQALDLYQGRKDAYVAIKRIQSAFDQEVDAVRLFREIHILRRLRGHECIIQLLDVVQPPSEDLDDFHDLYLVFEYVDTDLYKLIYSPQYLTTEHIQTFLYQMLAGLRFLHSASVIHRDLKPANILLNEDCSLKICDFGLARIVDAATMMSSTAATSTTTKGTNTSSDPIDDDDELSATRRGRGPSGGLPPKNFSTMRRAPLTRQLTKHVVTRWYRAPELILIQPYTSAVDIWSLGCILAELLSMQEGSVPGYSERSPLFPGGTCYPLSGDTSLSEERLDQLSVIFGVIGTPSPEDIAAIGKANEYIKRLGNIQPKKLEGLFPAADPNALDLLRQMLRFNPKRRCTAEEAIEHEFLKNVRRQEMERLAEKPLVGPEFLDAVEIDLQTLKRRTYEEVLWYRDQNPRPKAKKAE